MQRYVLLVVFLTALTYICVQPAYAARLLFSPETVSVTSGETTSVGLLLDPQGEAIIGTDVFLQFDPGFLELTKIEKTSTFPNQYALSINNQTGRAKFALVNPQGTYTRTFTKIAEVFVKGKSPVSSTVLAFNFTGTNSTNDSNVVVDQGKDVLSQAQGAVFTINTAPGNNTSTTTNSDSDEDDSTDDASSDSETTGEVAGGTTTTDVDIVVPPPSGQVLSFPEASNTLALTTEPKNGTRPPGEVQSAVSPAPVPQSNPFAKNQQLGLILLLVGLVLGFFVIRLVRWYWKRKEDEPLASDIST